MLKKFQKSFEKVLKKSLKSFEKKVFKRCLKSLKTIFFKFKVEKAFKKVLK